MTYTYVLLPISKQSYEEILLALQDAGYDHAIHTDSHHRIILDMHGIALARKSLDDKSA